MLTGSPSGGGVQSHEIRHGFRVHAAPPRRKITIPGNAGPAFPEDDPMTPSARRPLAALLVLLSAAGLPAQDNAAPPKGELAKYTFASSKIFPGTTREYSVYIPRQYDPSKPACVHVNQDG